LKDGGTWNLLAGQPTDDSEMALILARTLISEGAYNPESAFNAYRYWLDSSPFDCGSTISAALNGYPNPRSQANGAMMRICPLGIFGAKHSSDKVSKWAMEDARLTHPNPVCLQANALFSMAIAHAVRIQTDPGDLYSKILDWAKELDIDRKLIRATQDAADNPPEDYVINQGWVLIAWQNVLWQLLHSQGLENAVIDTVIQGGDTDTNGAICGALLGAVYGYKQVPKRWSKAVLSCKPQKGQPDVKNPRPEIFWPVDALDIAEKLTC
ncbi:MAG: ADP-ribosylglycohydrolase family protein, partial [Desulfonatronovibrio sp.]